MPNDFLSELRWRGLIHQATHEDELSAHLADPAHSPRRIYVGFDPTADSLTIGNLVPIMMLAHLQRAGHIPVVVMGGGTGLIGDPSGKSEERTLMTDEMVASNVRSQKRIFERVLSFEGPTGAKIANNLDWLGSLGYIEALRDIGKHFSVNMMIQKESVRERLHNREQGISYTEFSYMILQAYDFLHLYRDLGVTVQMGGSDQWGNIVAGSDLIRRCCDSAQTFGITAPLVTKADGGKFGKTESGAVWLTAERTSPFAMYQFWLNTADEDVIKFLRLFTFLTESQVNELASSHAENPGGREAHRALAEHATTVLHGSSAYDDAQKAAQALFSGDVRQLPVSMLEEVFAQAPSTDHDRLLLNGDGVPIVDILALTSLADSKGQARKLLAQSAISVNGERVQADRTLSPDDLLGGQVIALRRGKKAWHVTRWA